MDKMKKGNWTLQKHSWSDKVHWDLRLEMISELIGFTFLSNPLDKKKLHHIFRKKNHSKKWLVFEGDIKPGNPGNPTSHLLAHMQIIDSGKYELEDGDDDIMHIVFDGKRLKGQYVLQKDDKKKWTFRKAITETLTASFPLEIAEILGMAISGVAMKAGPYTLTNGETVEIEMEHLDKIADLLPNTIIDFAHNDPKLLAMFGFDQPQDFGRVLKARVNREKRRVEFDGELTNPAGKKMYDERKIAGHSIDLDLLRNASNKVLSWFRVKALTSVPKPMKPQSDDAAEFIVTDA